MTDTEKAKIRRLREQKVSYQQISKALSIPLNTVKSFCRRNGLGADMTSRQQPAACKQCGQPLVQKPKCKPRQFCSDRCRSAWWSRHKELLNQKTIYKLQCIHCNKEFESYGKKDRKYCSHACYIKHRFGQEDENV